MLKIVHLMRYASIAAVVLAGSCAAPMNDGSTLSGDGAANHPITVAPRYASIKLPFSAPAAGLMPDDAARFDAFVADYLQHGNGSISVSAPSGPESTGAIAYFAERLFAMGVPRDRIMVGTHDVTGGDNSVEIGYVGYIASSDPCGDWSKSLGDTSGNVTSPNFGCAVQHNIAAMVSDPRDLVQPQPLAAGDTERRTTVIGNYDKGKITASDKSQDQSVKISTVGNP